MGIFRYRMQNILDIKSKMEEQAKNEFATANLKVLQEQELLKERFQRKQHLEMEAVALLHEDTLNIRNIIQNKHGILKSEEAIEMQKQQVISAKQMREEKREQLTESMKERKTHEKLRENAFEEFLSDEKTAEGKEIDQLTSYTYGQKQKNNR